MSKKKTDQKQKCAKSKTREVQFNVDVKDGMLGFSIDQSSLQIIIENNEATNSFVKTSYKREKGEKIVNLIPTDPGRTFIAPDSALINNSDMAFVIDTNTKFISEKKLSFVAIIQLKKVIKNGKIAFKYSTPFCFKFTCAEKPELVSIMMLIRVVIKSLIAQEKKRILIVTDTELGNIHKYNEREVPICGQFYLPHNMAIAYASADTGNDIINGAIKMADGVATKLYNHFKEKKIPFNEGETITNLCSNFQIIYLENGCAKGSLSY